MSYSVEVNNKQISVRKLELIEASPECVYVPLFNSPHFTAYIHLPTSQIPIPFNSLFSMYVSTFQPNTPITYHTIPYHTNDKFTKLHLFLSIYLSLPQTQKEVSVMFVISLPFLPSREMNPI